MEGSTVSHDLVAVFTSDVLSAGNDLLPLTPISLSYMSFKA